MISSGDKVWQSTLAKAHGSKYGLSAIEMITEKFSKN
jgi:hypothetical protein